MRSGSWTQDNDVEFIKFTASKYEGENNNIEFINYLQTWHNVISSFDKNYDDSVALLF